MNQQSQEQIACSECGFGWNEFTHGQHYTHCSQYYDIDTERVKFQERMREALIDAGAQEVDLRNQ